MLGNDNYFLLDHIDIVKHTECTFNEQQHKFEFSYAVVSNAKASNYLKNVLQNIPTYSDEMQGELTHWKDYLDWKQKLAELKILASKYIGVRLIDYEGTEPRIAFLVVAPSKADFDRFRNVMMREKNQVAVYTNRFSTNPWTFNYNKDTKNGSIAILSLERINPYAANRIYWQEAERYLKKDSDDTDSIEKLERLVKQQYEEFPDPVFFEMIFYLADEDERWLRDNWHVDDEDQDNDALIDKVHRRLLSHFPLDGFIGTSHIGDFALIRRMKTALKNLEEGRAVSGNLGNWVFDITKARLASQSSSAGEIEWSPWGKQHLNDSQKAVVRKMLEAPDVFLCQGPPGTGKTTVIAEVVYQLTKQKKRVLIASQTNLAVNNALSKLLKYNYPGIRAIRLGSENKIDESVEAITDANILRTFYGNMCHHIQEGYLDPWEKVDTALRQLESELKAVSSLNKIIQYAEDRMEELFGNCKDLSQQIEEEQALADQRYTQAETNRTLSMRFSGYAEDVAAQKVPKAAPYFDSEQSLTMLEVLKEHLEALRSQGFCIPAYADLSKIFSSFNLKVKNQSLYEYTLLFLWINKLANGVAKPDIDAQELNEIELELRAIADADDMSDADILRMKELKRRKKELQQGGIQAQIPSPEVMKLFPEKLQRCFSEESSFNSISSSIPHKWQNVAFSASNAIVEYCSEIAQSLLNDGDDGEQKITALRKEQSVAMSEIAQLQAEKDNCIGKINEIARRYGCTASNLVDVLIQKMGDVKSEQPVNLNRHDFEHFFRDLLSYVDSISNDYSHENEQYLTDFINSCNVVGISCTESSQTLTEKGFDAFDVAIIDEVSKATPPELLIPLILAEKAILVGDHRQLPPLFGEHQESYNEYVQSVKEDDDESQELLTPENYGRFKELVTNSLFKQHYEQADAPNKGALLTQYRMHSEIMDVVNMFYDGQLNSGWSPEEEQKEKAHFAHVTSFGGHAQLITPEHHAYWIDSSSLHGMPVYEHQEGSSKCNYLEARLIAELVKQINESYAQLGNGHRVEIGIISFYMAQVKLIRKELDDLRLPHVHLEINTVDRFQGKEKEIVIVSMVRNIPASRLYSGLYDTSYIKAFQRVNVAVSRAQKLLLLIGAQNMYVDQHIDLEDMDTGKIISSVPVYRNMIEDLSMRGCRLTADEILPPSEKSHIDEWTERSRRR